MNVPDRRPPKRKDDRVILQFDYDCFYAQVFENKDPSLKSRPLGVKQKNILATCNYAARAQGVRKLQLVVEAKRACPSLVLVNGEDLTPFRNASKLLFGFLKSRSWNGKVERLGFDEVFMDVTDIVEYNLDLLNRNSLATSFFHLSQKDPENGFLCDLTSVAGCVEGNLPDDVDLENSSYLRLLLGSHLGKYLRSRMEQDFGYTSTCGISTNKLLSKIIGSKNKPRNQTTLLALKDQDIMQFMDGHGLRSIPGVGSRFTSLIEAHVFGLKVDSQSNQLENKSSVTVGQVRSCPIISPSSLEKLLIGPGAEKGVGGRLWALLHGVDPTEVKETSDVATQISVEDTYKGLDTMSRIIEELHKLSCSLLQRMRLDLLVEDEHAASPSLQRWLARPSRLRLSVRLWPNTGSLHHQSQSQSQSFNRISRSGPLPSFVFETQADIDHLAGRLVSEALLPLLRRLQDDKAQKWNLQLINICVANMMATAADDRIGGVGRDISNMFRNQDQVLAPWKLIAAPEHKTENHQDLEMLTDDDGVDSEEMWETADHSICSECSHSIPSFARLAHLRYHEMGE